MVVLWGRRVSWPVEGDASEELPWGWQVEPIKTQSTMFNMDLRMINHNPQANKEIIVLKDWFTM